MNFFKTLLVGAALALAVQAIAVPVALELVLAADVSGSIDASEFNLQKQGYKNAFLDATVQASIVASGGVAVTYVEWSSNGTAVQVVGWSLLQTAADATAFGNAIYAAGRSSGGLTAPGSAINFSTNILNTNSFQGTRRVIDVSGDGAQNDGANTALARNAAAAQNITINGVTIGTEVGLQTWYQNNVVTADGFHMHATGFTSFENAIKTKIHYEINNDDPTVPEPSTLGLLGLGLVAMVGAIARRRRA